MAWSLTGELVETCSCNMLCPCWFGVKELMVMDQGWCASTLLFRIQQGSSDGVNLGGRTVVLALDFPGPTLLDGNGTARIYVDAPTTDDQRHELESIFQGRKGGPNGSVGWITNQMATHPGGEHPDSRGRRCPDRHSGRIWPGEITAAEERGRSANEDAERGICCGISVPRSGR